MATPTTVDINGFALREIRVRSGIGVLELAGQVGVQRPYIAKIELGHSQRVSPKVFNALLSALSIQDRRVLLANPHVNDLAQAAGQ
jgi:transcriptional regulator with XRE-family HTH domain